MDDGMGSPLRCIEYVGSSMCEKRPRHQTPMIAQQEKWKADHASTAGVTERARQLKAMLRSIIGYRGLHGAKWASRSASGDHSLRCKHRLLRCSDAVMLIIQGRTLDRLSTHARLSEQRRDRQAQYHSPARARFCLRGSQGRVGQCTARAPEDRRVVVEHCGRNVGVEI